MLDDDNDYEASPELRFRIEKNAFVQLGLILAELSASDIVDDYAIHAVTNALHAKCMDMYFAHLFLEEEREDTNVTYH